MEDLKILFTNPVSASVFTVLVTLIILNIIALAKSGKLSKITRDGIEFNNTSEKEVQDLKESHAATRSAIIELSAQVTKLETSVNEIRLACLRLQIISDEVSMETKLKLYDDYKALGGNSYIDMYIKELEAKEN